MQKTKTDIAKTIVSCVVGYTTAAVVRTLIKQNIEPDNATDKVAITVGTYVLGGMAADAAKHYTDHAIDDVVDWWKVNVNGVKPEYETE